MRENETDAGKFSAYTYVILKTDDIENGLDNDEQLLLFALLTKIRKYREENEMDPHPQYVIMPAEGLEHELEGD